MTNSKQLILDIAGSEHDFEFYPTTYEIISTIKSDIENESIKSKNPSVLDVGAGDGRVLNGLTLGKRYAIEKSSPLLNALSKDIFVVGTDFHQQTLIDKKVDVVFSNPPYKEYESFAAKIIKEANAKVVYLVIPTRWNNSNVINEALGVRRAKTEVIDSFDFLEADRAARAKVDVLRIMVGESSWGVISPKVDPFKLWFEENFAIDVNKEKVASSTNNLSKREQVSNELKNELVCGKDVVSTLESLYQRDLDKLITTYKSLELVDEEILKELNVNLEGLCEALAQRISGLKDLYWKELFSNLSKVTDRLASSSRKKMLDTLFEHTQIDFTKANAYAVLTWVCKNANEYYDSQLIELMEDMTAQANVLLYKSNERVFRDEDWRYTRRPNGLNKYSLEYRVVISNMGGIDTGYWGDKNEGIKERAKDFLNDICTIARNIGFDTTDCERVDSFNWVSGQKKLFTYRDHVSGLNLTLFEAKAFKNGNLHIKFNETFMAKLNVEFGRLKGWLKSADEATNEMNIDTELAISSFNTNLQLPMDGSSLLTFKTAA
ncbi:class I SAM-dependent methyltransferase [Pseudoalteromonas spongiae]|uniref:class I SAM-dependent methyltransferase n=1 Tax=Pseudoalteromonas spongiae TaxID=298657 RepID=UPI000C2D2FFD|nr:DUF4942 domain-containing protein [Pseudoalteromonas spongiae]